MVNSEPCFLTSVRPTLTASPPASIHVCTILAAFQAAQHDLHNASSPNEIYQHIGPEVAIAGMLGLLTFSSLGLKTLAVMSLFRGRATHHDRFTSRAKGKTSAKESFV